jgi:hypothetical protein
MNPSFRAPNADRFAGVTTLAEGDGDETAVLDELFAPCVLFSEAHSVFGHGKISHR